MELHGMAMSSEDSKPSQPFWDMNTEELNALAQKAVDDAPGTNARKRCCIR